MQKLKRTLCRNGRGSALVSVVVLSILLAIAGVGLIQVTTSSLNNETTALENDRAFLAAESGIWAGVRWLRDPANNFTQTTDGITLKPFDDNPVTINGMDVYVTIPVHLINGVPSASVVAEVYLDRSGSHQKENSVYIKKMTVGDVRCQTFGMYGHFYDGYQSTNADDLANNRWNSSDAWGGWGSGRVFNGRFHINSMCNRLLDNSPRFNGLVTVARGNGQNDYGIGHHDNNYNSGIWGYLSGGSPTVDELDQIFTDRFEADVDPIQLNIDRTDAVSLRDDHSIPDGDKIVLPSSSRDEGYGPYQYRPTLYFDGPNAFYEYQDAAGTYQRIPYGPAAGAGNSINGRIFISTGNNLNVYSTSRGVTGRVSVATATGKSIVPVGNLVTDDYNFTTGKVPDSSDDMIGLISGGYIAFNKTWTRRFAGEDADAFQNVSAMTTGGGNAGPGDGCGTLHMTAAIMAVSKFTDNLRISSSGSRTSAYHMVGCEWWDGMWAQQPANGDFANRNNHCEDYGFQLYGNHILGGYARTVQTMGTRPDSTRGCNGGLTFTHDERMYKRFIQPPGFPGSIATKDSLLVLTLSNWSEENSY